MAVPDFQSFMLPPLKVTSNGEEFSHGEVVDAIALHLGLNDDD